MYPLLLTPPCMDYLWGGVKLKKDYNIKSDKTPLSEAWMLSCRDDYCNIVENGYMSGKSLSDVLENWGVAALGKNAARFPYFPLLIKLIDAKDQLSVQVHPNDDYALKNEGEFGKTEMWYILDCEPGAALYYGLNRDISKPELKKYIEQNRLDEILNRVEVHKGDVFFIPAGVIHSIGKGILLAEVQQNSNLTYRVYDFGRVGADGKPRALHIDKALEVMNLSAQKNDQNNVNQASSEPKIHGGNVKQLCRCDYFNARVLDMNYKTTICNNDSFTSLVCLDGFCDIAYRGGSLRMIKGTSVFVPAGVDIEIYGTATLLVSDV